MPMQEFSALTTAAGHLTNVFKTAFQTHTKVETDKARIELGEAILDLQGRISAVQISYQAMAEATQELKQKIASFEKWDEESSRYVLVPVSKNGACVYALKEPGADEAQHWVCPTCFQERRKSILQPINYVHFGCPNCKTVILATTAFPNIERGQQDRLEPDVEKLLLRYAHADRELTLEAAVEGMGLAKAKADYLFDQLKIRDFIRLAHGRMGGPITHVATPSGRKYLHNAKLLD